MLKKTHLENALTGLLGLCAIGVTLMLVRREFMPPPDTKTPRAPIEVKGWTAYAIGDKRIGPAHAAVTLVEFSDFQCPFCAQLAGTLQRVQAKYPGELAVVYRHFPLQAIHPHARSAALAAECAAAQGRFLEYHDFLFQHQDSIGKIPWTEVAARTDVPDTSVFQRCLGGTHAASQLRRDSIDGKTLKVNGTPTVMVNKWLMPGGAPTQEVLEKLIAQELQHAKRNRAELAHDQ